MTQQENSRTFWRDRQYTANNPPHSAGRPSKYIQQNFPVRTRTYFPLKEQLYKKCTRREQFF